MEKINVLNTEKATIKLMVAMYCHDKHGQEQGLCEDCADLEAYTFQQLERCQFLPEKPVCAKCPVHCYKSSYRQKVREVMRYAAPKMTTRAPIAVIRHLWLLLKPDSPRVKEIRARKAGQA